MNTEHDNKSVKQVIVPATEVWEYLRKIFSSGLIKDLHETEEYTEEVCPHCKGTGIVVYDNVYGIREEQPKYVTAMFPYKQQSIGACPQCHNGVVRRCNRCGEIMNRSLLIHDCDIQRKIRREKQEAEERERIAGLPWATKEQIDVQEMFYSDDFPYNDGYFSDFDEFFEAWDDMHEENGCRPEFCFGTKPIPFHLNMQEIVENECENLYEDAYEYCRNVDELQKMVNEWAEKNGPGSAYTKHLDFKIRIPWEEYDKEKEEEA